MLNAWERKIQDGHHLADLENQTIANVIYDRVIYDLRDQKCNVIFFLYFKVIITPLIEFLANLLNKYISNVGKSAPTLHLYIMKQIVHSEDIRESFLKNSAFCIFFPGSY